MPGRDELPRTLRKSPRKAQRTWIKAHDSGVETYGDGEQAHRTAWSAVKHTFEKVGDRWEEKDATGPSDPQAAKGAPEALERPSETFGGIDVRGSTKQELYERAKAVDVQGRSPMSKEELGRAVARKGG